MCLKYSDLRPSYLAMNVGAWAWTSLPWCKRICVQFTNLGVKLRYLHRVARLHIFKPKILIRVKILEDLAMDGVGKCIILPFGLFYGYLVYLWRFGIICRYTYGKFFPLLVCCTKKNLATLYLHRYWVGKPHLGRTLHSRRAQRKKGGK
jgi:hypothetical protein